MGSKSCPEGFGSGRRIIVVTLALFFALVSGGFWPGNGFAAKNVTISGSTMLFPLEQVWALAYMKSHPGTHISVASTGSGFGISNAANGNITVGASDAYLTKEFRQRYPNLVSIPIAFDDAQVIYNIPGLDKKAVLKFDGKVLARIYLGKIHFWDDRQIRSLNPDVRLPHTRIRVVHRADASGTSFVFTDYLNQTSPEWFNQVGRDMSPAWPTGSGYNGSDAVVAAVMSSPGSIGYVGLGWVMEYHLTTGALKNLDGHFVVGTVETIRAAGHAALKDPSFPDDFNRSIVWNIHGKNVYPDANFEFWMVNTNLDAETMKTVRTLVMWALTKGQASRYTVKSGFAPLPFRPLKPRLDKIINRLLPGNGFKERSPG
ncbi:MAG: phosphate ABC transporter substrate-binding protein PstS [Leptospirillum sp.]